MVVSLVWVTFPLLQLLILFGLSNNNRFSSDKRLHIFINFDITFRLFPWIVGPLMYKRKILWLLSFLFLYVGHEFQWVLVDILGVFFTSCSLDRFEKAGFYLLILLTNITLVPFQRHSWLLFQSLLLGNCIHWVLPCSSDSFQFSPSHLHCFIKPLLFLKVLVEVHSLHSPFVLSQKWDVDYLSIFHVALGISESFSISNEHKIVLRVLFSHLFLTFYNLLSSLLNT